MDELVSFESYLFGEDFDDNRIIIENIPFLIDRIKIFPSLRPLKIEKVVSLCEECMKLPGFREIILIDLFLKCPILIYRLFHKGYYTFNEIYVLLKNNKGSISIYYYKDQLKSFNNEDLIENVNISYDLSMFCDQQILDMIQYGFIPKSLEYCLKYDDVDNIKSKLSAYIVSSPGEAIWSPFEWSSEPKSKGFLAVSGFFGSIKCFKQLLVLGYPIDETVFSCVSCNGSPDLFHICAGGFLNYSKSLLEASRFLNMSIVDFLLRNGIDINTKDKMIVLM